MMEPEAIRPVKLTFPAREPGARRIMADGVQVGHVLANWHMDWTAYLWLEPGRPGCGFAPETITRCELAAAREAVRGRLADGGPWWSREHPDGLET